MFTTRQIKYNLSFISLLSGGIVMKETVSNEMLVKPHYTWKDKVKAIGPGAMITASFIGPGTVTTCTRVGASYGYSLIWTVVFAIITTMVLQEMSARLGIVTQNGLGEAIVNNCKSKAMRNFSIALVGISITVGCAAYISGDLTGSAMGISTITGINVNTIGPIIGIIVFALVYKGSFKLLEKILTGLVVIMATVFVTTMFVAKPDLGGIAKGLVPTIPKGGLMLVISLIGTTIVPYNFFIHAASAKNNFKSTDELELSKWDTYVSIGIGGLITAAILITSGTLMLGMDVKSAADLSVQLEPLLGSWSSIFLSIGLFAAGLSSAIATPLGASYTLAGLLGWEYSNSDKRFRNVNLTIVAIGTVMSGIGLNPMTILLIAQALNGIILPVVVIYLVVITCNKKILGQYTNNAVAKIIGIIISVITVILGGSALISALQGLF